ncbi:class A beta-lactamase [Methylobacterium isbiliense]|uniref:Beta-lactamase n=1 Tax=Methylobacterium isbiliense TaxID=315478 RepID=A0ABQ4SLJ2_9HYPH|nr:class A beta-lactamase [Methylobacterium isbiliense]MDN3626511.1 class A beta-lactamase [Methylobacterium isbiliense]GJE03394.1 Beta-lactamase Toho-1 [Methylobacterium isbiliense]
MLQFTRRAMLVGTALAACRAVAAEGPEEAVARLAALERQEGGRLGVCVRDTGTGRVLSYRADERFALCSTFKAVAAAAVLARVDRGEERLERRMAYGPGDLDTYAPVTAKHVAEGAMTLEDLCAAAVVWSDNTAGNLLLQALDGPEGFTAYVRSQGDTVTRLDRTEPTLNTAIPGDPRDTTTPAAIAGLLERILLGPALSPASRTRLLGWMAESPTGAKRLRAGLPPDWQVGDKTGTGENGTANVVAVIRRQNSAPLIAAVYLTQSPGTPDARNALHAEVGRLVTRTFPA